MKKAKMFFAQNKILSIALILTIAIVAVGTAKAAIDGVFNIQNVEVMNVGVSGGGDAEEGMFGSRTRSDWNVGGNLTIDGTSTLTGAVTMGGALSGVTSGSISGALDTGALTQGGGILATSTTAAVGTLTAAQLAAYNVIDFTPLGAAATLTLPATSTMTTLLPNAGDYRDWVIRNAATAATTTTIAAGTGIDLQEPDGQNGVIGQNNFAWMTCYRKTDTDVVCLVNETIPAD